MSVDVPAPKGARTLADTVMTTKLDINLFNHLLPILDYIFNIFSQIIKQMTKETCQILQSFDGYYGPPQALLSEAYINSLVVTPTGLWTLAD